MKSRKEKIMYQLMLDSTLKDFDVKDGHLFSRTLEANRCYCSVINGVRITCADLIKYITPNTYIWDEPWLNQS